MLSHVNKRVRDHREIGLPLPQLVALFQASFIQPSAFLHRVAHLRPSWQCISFLCRARPLHSFLAAVFQQCTRS